MNPTGAIKTLHLTNAWHETSGGISTFYRALLRAAGEESREIRLIVPGERTQEEQCGPHARIYHIEAPRAPMNASYRVLYPRRFLLPGTAIQKILRAERPDVIEVCDKYNFNYLAGLIRRGWVKGLAYRPTLVGLTCERMDENFAAYLSGNDLGKRFCSFYMKWVYFGLFDHHIANSEHTATELVPASRGHMVSRGVWIRPMGVDCGRLSPTRRSPQKQRALREGLGVPPGAKLLLYAGRLAPEKNLPLLVDLMVESSRSGAADVHLTVAGSGMSRESLERDCRARVPGRVTFLDHVGDPERMADLYANVDAFVHPNPREPFGIAPLEAMASGTPLVAPNTGGITSYANGGNAWLTQAQPVCFAAAIENALTATPERERKLGRARVTAESYRWEKVTRDFLDLYDELHWRMRGQIRRPELQPRFFSTAGDWLGRELRAGAPRTA